MSRTIKIQFYYPVVDTQTPTGAELAAQLQQDSNRVGMVCTVTLISEAEMTEADAGTTTE